MQSSIHLIEPFPVMRVRAAGKAVHAELNDKPVSPGRFPCLGGLDKFPFKLRQMI